MHARITLKCNQYPASDLSEPCSIICVQNITQIDPTQRYAHSMWEVSAELVMHGSYTTANCNGCPVDILSRQLIYVYNN